MPSPVILCHVAQCCVYTALGCNGMGACGEELRDNGGVEARLCEADGGSETCTTSSDDDSIIVVVYDIELVVERID